MGRRITEQLEQGAGVLVVSSPMPRRPLPLDGDEEQARDVVLLARRGEGADRAWPQHRRRRRGPPAPTPTKVHSAAQALTASAVSLSAAALSHSSTAARGSPTTTSVSARFPARCSVSSAAAGDFGGPQPPPQNPSRLAGVLSEELPGRQDVVDHPQHCGDVVLSGQREGLVEVFFGAGVAEPEGNLPAGGERVDPQPDI